jgi:EAL domain-containing protein (putative c-di-GMP-specific phosphodiesterase class I)
VRAVITLAHNLRLKVIAEGVETQEHCRVLRAHNCDEIQGYYFSKPVSAQEFEQIIRQGRRLGIAGVEHDGPEVADLVVL